MPPKPKFSREQVISAALDIVRENGIEKLNARALSRRLGCSTQPLFREFSGMDDIRAGVVLAARGLYGEYMAASASMAETEYKGAGVAYIKFAREESELFKLLFMCDRSGDPAAESWDGSVGRVLDMLAQKLGLTPEMAGYFHLHMWIYCHGLATMLATGYLSFTDEEISGLLSDEYLAFAHKYGAGPEKEN